MSMTMIQEKTVIPWKKSALEVDRNKNLKGVRYTEMQIHAPNKNAYKTKQRTLLTNTTARLGVLPSTLVQRFPSINI